MRLVAAHGRAEQQVRVAADELGRRVQDDVGAELERALAQRRRERRIHDRDRTTLTRARRDRGHVGHGHERVGDGLDPDHVGAVGCGEDGVRVVGGGQTQAQAAMCLQPLEDVPDTEIGHRRQHHGPAGRHEVGDGGGRGEPRCERHRPPSVERPERGLECAPAGVAVAAVFDGRVLDVGGAHRDRRVHRCAGRAGGPAGLDRDGLGRPSRIEGQWRRVGDWVTEVVLVQARRTAHPRALSLVPGARIGRASGNGPPTRIPELDLPSRAATSLGRTGHAAGSADREPALCRRGTAQIDACGVSRPVR